MPREKVRNKKWTAFRQSPQNFEEHDPANYLQGLLYFLRHYGSACVREIFSILIDEQINLSGELVSVSINLAHIVVLSTDSRCLLSGIAISLVLYIYKNSDSPRMGESLFCVVYVFLIFLATKL
jgi:hypothetical protein